VGSDGGSLELDEHGNVVPDDEPATATAAGARPDDADVAAELAALRATVDVLVSRLDGAARGDA
jgi:hypothetical protein